MLEFDDPILVPSMFDRTTMKNKPVCWAQFIAIVDNPAPKNRKDLGGIFRILPKKYYLPKKDQLRQSLFPGDSTLEFIDHIVRQAEALEIIVQHEIEVQRLTDLVAQLNTRDYLIPQSPVADLIELAQPGGDAFK